MITGVEFGAPVVAAAIEIAILSMIVIAVRLWFGGADKAPVEPIGLIEWLVDLASGHRRRVLNVECRLRDGILFVKHFVPVLAHNGTGPVYHIERGVFFGCDAKHCDVGSQVTIWVGRLRFDLVVRLDPEKEVPYVIIPHTRRELIALLNAQHGGPADAKTATDSERRPYQESA